MTRGRAGRLSLILLIVIALATLAAGRRAATRPRIAAPTAGCRPGPRQSPRDWSKKPSTNLAGRHRTMRSTLTGAKPGLATRLVSPAAPRMASISVPFPAVNPPAVS